MYSPVSITHGTLSNESSLSQSTNPENDCLDSTSEADSNLASGDTLSTPSGSLSNDTSESESQTSTSKADTSEMSSLDLDAFLGPQPSVNLSLFPSFKLVGDNINKEVQPRDMRGEHQSRSLHYFHSYAVCDRINVADVSDIVTSPDISQVDLTEILPTPSDNQALLSNYTLLIFRVLRKYMAFFARFGKVVERHIQHEYSYEMAQKSIVVSKFKTFLIINI